MTSASFTNEPVLELRRAAVRQQLGGALDGLDARLPLSVPLCVGEDSRGPDGSPGLESTDPGSPGRVVARAAAASVADVDAAVRSAHRAFETREGWSQAAPQERAGALHRAAEWMRARRLELAALEVRECAKPWREADADVCEAIDFLEYYAMAAVELSRGKPLIQVPGERNELRYVARGVAAVISPWNFPLAIPCGMTAAALSVGNTVVLKPAEQSPACAWMLVEALRAGGVPRSVLGFLPGGGEIGAALVRHPLVATIAFTGSQPVGLEIMSAAAEVAPGQRQLKRMIAELGGKNCVLVDADADLDEAVPAVLASAFAYAGQKCSAASRVLVHEAVADTLIERLAGAAAGLVIGQASELATDVPPLIDRDAQERIIGCTEQAARQGRVVAQVRPPAGDGWFAPVTVLTDLPAGSPVLTDELFGPVLAVERVGSLDAAVETVSALPFALTGALFTRNPQTVRSVAARLPVGNLYVNRGSTGAMVGRQPFGGNRLSGNGTKAGGPDYLMQFVEPRVVTENTMRHGLVV